MTGDFLDALVPRVTAIRTGDPAGHDTTMGTLISETEAVRVQRMIDDAAASGARVLVGGSREGAVVEPTVVADVDPSSPLHQQELFGPAVAVSSAATGSRRSRRRTAPRTACRRASSPATSAGAVRAIREIDAGNVHINWTPLWRADLMPYGGLKGSGIGKEGPRRAVAEMTEEKTVVLHGRPW